MGRSLSRLSGTLVIVAHTGIVSDPGWRGGEQPDLLGPGVQGAGRVAGVGPDAGRQRQVWSEPLPLVPEGSWPQAWPG